MTPDFWFLLLCFSQTSSLKLKIMTILFIKRTFFLDKRTFILFIKGFCFYFLSFIYLLYIYVVYFHIYVVYVVYVMYVTLYMLCMSYLCCVFSYFVIHFVYKRTFILFIKRTHLHSLVYLYRYKISCNYIKFGISTAWQIKLNKHSKTKKIYIFFMILNFY